MMLALSEKCDNNGEMKIDGSIGDKKNVNLFRFWFEYEWGS